MLTAERRQYILKTLERDVKIVAKEVSEELGISEDTIRRDLRELAASGLLQRVHGGALPCGPAHTSFAARQQVAPAAKQAIAQAAARLVRNGQILLLDSGTTNVEVARQLAPDLQATVITNSPPVALALAEHPRVEIFLLGGHLHKRGLSTIGVATLEELRTVRADLYFIGVCSLHPEVGISTDDLEEAHLKRAMLGCAAEVIAPVSSDKLNTAAPYIIGPAREVNELITEQTVAEEALAPFHALGIAITRA